jgi:hypothetical protein
MRHEIEDTLGQLREAVEVHAEAVRKASVALDSGSVADSAALAEAAEALRVYLLDVNTFIDDVPDEIWKPFCDALQASALPSGKQQPHAIRPLSTEHLGGFSGPHVELGTSA